VIQFVIAFLASYFAGSIPFGYLIARFHGIDIRKAGSGNIGATNVTRSLGKAVGALVFVLDFAKGAVPVWIAGSVGGESGLAEVAGISALIGHMFPIWLQFRGGKGVATGAGVVSILLPLPALIGLLCWIATLVATRFVSLASIAAAAAVCLFQVALTPEPFKGDGSRLTLFSFTALVLVTVRHLGNVGRILRGQEHQISESSIMRNLGKVIHVLAMGLWFGSNIFFTFVVALVVLRTWQSYGQMSFSERPIWLPVGAGFNEDSGTRIFGATVAPLFPFLFLIQAICSLLALVTAVGFSRAEPKRRVHRVRFVVLMLAALTVIVGWPLSQKVGDLRLQRYDPDPAISAPAKAEFARMHTISLFLNFATVVLVTAGMGLAAFPPANPPRTEPGPPT
jgi:acyl-phosphate glycerol 3-phosphate acyltransferase